MRKTLKHDSACDIALIMFYKNRRSLIFKVLGIFVYSFIYKYVCVFIICVFKEEQSCFYYTEDLKILHLIISQELAFQKVY